MILKGIVYFLAFLVSLLWFNKLIIDCVSAMYGNEFSDESAKTDAKIRGGLMVCMSILWTLVIVIW